MREVVSVARRSTNINIARQMPLNFWNEKENQHFFIEKIANILKIKTQQDWKLASTRLVIQLGGITLLHKYNNSVLEILKSRHPQLKWDKSDREKMPQNYWYKIENQHFLLNEMARLKNIKTQNNWKSVTIQTLNLMGGRTLLHHQYNDSIFEMLHSLYPELPHWHYHGRTSMPRNYWETTENQRLLLDKMSNLLHVHTQQDWISITTQNLRHSGGNSLVHQYNGSVFDMLQSLHPEINWNNSYRDHLPRNYWAVPDNQHHLVELIAKQLSIHIYEDWQQIYQKKILDMTGTTIKRIYPDCFTMFTTVYPQFPWHPLAQRKVSTRLWNLPQSHGIMVDMLKKYFNIQDKSDWYRLSLEQISCVFGRSINRNNFMKMLLSVYPNENWIYEEFSQRKKSRQRWMLLKIRDIFPDQLILENYRHHDLKQDNGYPMELDVFLPCLGLAFEFHGEQHYMEIARSGFTSLEGRLLRDKEKFRLCNENGIKLIVVPYWWDNKLNSLVGTVLQHYPISLEVLQDIVIGDPIPTICPINKF